MAWDFRLYNDFLQCFAIVGSKLYRYDISFDMSLTKVWITALFVNVNKFDGSKYNIQATPKEIIVACGDCTTPGVYFFDETLTMFDQGSFPISNPSKAPLHMAADFEDKLRRTRLVVGSQARVD